MQGLGYSGDSPKSWATRNASMDMVGEARGVVAVNEIQRLLESLPEDDGASIDDRNKILRLLDASATGDPPAGSVSPLRLHGPIANATMPRGSIP